MPQSHVLTVLRRTRLRWATPRCTAADVTLAELSIESFFPADEATDRAVRAATS